MFVLVTALLHFGHEGKCLGTLILLTRILQAESVEKCVYSKNISQLICSIPSYIASCVHEPAFKYLSRNTEDRAKRDESGERKVRAEKAEQSGRSLLTSEIQTGVEAGTLSKHTQSQT